jgi:hypothetical protein
MSTFKNLEPDDIVAGRVQNISLGLFPGGSTTFSSSLYYSSIQSQITGSSEFEPKSGLYYLDVYNENPDINETAEILFSTTYGHLAGSGSSTRDLTTSKILPTQAVYTQYQNLILTPGDSQFTFQSGSGDTASTVDSPDIYVINFASNRFKERLVNGRFQFSISGSNGLFTFVDESAGFSVTGSTSTKSAYNIVSGSLGTSTTLATVFEPQAVGIVYPKLGTILLNPSKLSEIVGSDLTPDVGGATSYALNHIKLYEALDKAVLTKGLEGGNEEAIPARHYFVRVKNQEFNYSNNPTFALQETEVSNPNDEGKIRFDSFQNDPNVYITTIGLYDDNNELIAVAKTSQPIQKTFSSEALIKIKLNF